MKYDIQIYKYCIKNKIEFLIPSTDKYIIMGNSFSHTQTNYETIPYQTLVLQTGKLRGEEINKGYDSLSLHFQNL